MPVEHQNQYQPIVLCGLHVRQRPKFRDPLRQLIRYPGRVMHYILSRLILWQGSEKCIIDQEFHALSLIGNWRSRTA